MTVDRIGERLRRYRRAAKKTLHQVASESGLTASFLSQAERNLTGVSISSLANIAKSLNIPLNALFDQPAQPQPDSHEGERVRYTIEGQPLAYERLSSSFPGNLINAVKMNMPVGYQSELISHEGAEFSYVLSGQIVYQAVEKLGFNCPNPSGLALFQALWPNGVHTRPDFRPF